MAPETTTKHAPEPWQIDSDTRSGLHTLVFDGSGDAVCDCAPGMGADDLAVAGAECEANARLIAAAPDLLAALEEAITLIEFFHGAPGWPEYQSSPEMKRIRAASARARGEEVRNES